jgi:hypothetical protein
MVTSPQQSLSGLAFREQAGVVDDDPQCRDSKGDLQARKIGCFGLSGYFARILWKFSPSVGRIAFEGTLPEWFRAQV